MGLLLIGPLQYCDPPTTTSTARETVNAIDYEYTKMEPAMKAYKLVASDMGVPDWKIDAWEPFVYDIIAKESGGCWNLKRGQIPKPGSCTELARNPRRTGSDSGFGQLISIWYRGPRTPLCRNLGICSQAAVIASPYSSMQSLVHVLQLSGKQPWCYNAWARRFHNCRIAPNGTL